MAEGAADRFGEQPCRAVAAGAGSGMRQALEFNERLARALSASERAAFASALRKLTAVADAVWEEMGAQGEDEAA